ncbi:Na/Pi cotransporter family protein [Bacillus sp. H-16]|uniref:Na/Pi cotransporter family protein n=1 Tax=Alteribacter salitolerans TaxID=2912333 RepID=UPI00196455AF|nr:Na/Pi cotransporter family protein [Alteribacter salitolerans]MBM7095765.1 Na/Pi cotransporter family protein [Alteribacter salitolerans]
MDLIQIILGVIGGLGIFLYGMHLASDGLKQSASKQLKSFLKRVTKNQVYGSGAGMVLAAVLQSSSAATVMVVGFVNAGLMTLRQSMGVVLGSAIGTTLTVQLIAFKVTDYALVFVSLGVLMFLIAKTQTIQHVGNIILGFGFVFFGMALMTNAMIPVQQSPEFMNWFVAATSNPIITILIATAFTAIIQNSAATIAIAMTLAVGGSMSMETAIAIVYGANIGTVITALISSLNASKDAQRTAVAHALFKIIGVLVFIPATFLFIQVLQTMGGSVERQIANAHTLFNIVNLLILLPFCNLFADWMTKLIKDKKSVDDFKYLDKNSLNFPTVALLNTQKELQYMAEKISERMFQPLLPIYVEEGSAVRQQIQSEEKRIDHLYRGIYHYLQEITEKKLTDDESRESLQMLYVNNDLEGISDIINELSSLSIKLEGNDILLSEWEKESIQTLFDNVFQNFQDAVECFSEKDHELATKVVHQNPAIIRLEKELRFKHFHTEGGPSSRVSSVYMDLLNGLLRINQHSVNISQTTLGMI